MSLEDFLKFYFNNQYCYSVETMDYLSDTGLDYLLWDQTLDYCEKNIDDNVELHALFAEMFIYGKGVEKDFAKGVEILNQGIEANSVYCMRKKAGLIIDGKIAGHDYEAFELLERGSKLNCPHCTLNLGWMYNRGYGCDHSLDKAYELYEKASKLGSIVGKYNYGMSLLSYDLNRGYQLLEEAANFGYDNAQNRLGVYYSDGKYVDKDYQKAYYWFKKAALQDNSIAFRRLADFYINGQGVKKDVEMAEYCLKVSIRLGNEFARRSLAYLYLDNVNDDN